MANPVIVKHANGVEQWVETSALAAALYPDSPIMRYAVSQEKPAGTPDVVQRNPTVQAVQRMTKSQGGIYLWDDFKRKTAPAAGADVEGTLGKAVTGQPWRMNGAGYQSAKIDNGLYVSGPIGTGQNIYALAALGQKIRYVRGVVSWLPGVPQTVAMVVNQYPVGGVGFTQWLVHPYFSPTSVGFQVFDNGVAVGLATWVTNFAQDGRPHEFSWAIKGNSAYIWLPGDITPRVVTDARISTIQGTSVYFQILDQAGMTGLVRYHEVEALAWPD